jgi:hypothetical protein
VDQSIFFCHCLAGTEVRYCCCHYGGGERREEGRRVAGCWCLMTMLSLGEARGDVGQSLESSESSDSFTTLVVVTSTE